MKKGILVFLSILFLMVPASVFAQNSFTLTLNAVNSGATTTSKTTTGTSTFVINGNASSTYLDLESVAAPYLGINITGITPSQAALGLGSGTYSGNTFQVLYSIAQDSSALSAQEKIPIFYNDALNSGITRYERTIQIPFSRFVQFYLRPSGNYAYDSVSLKVYAGKDASWLPPQPVLISEGTFTMPASTGTSTFYTSVVSNIEGVRYGEFSVAGSSRFYTTDGSTPTIDNNGMHVADLKGFSLTGNEIQKLKFVGSSSACKIHYKLLTRDPLK